MKIGIVTINDNNNYGNRLQNYALQEVLKKLGVYPKTLINSSYTNTKEKYLFRLIKKAIKGSKYSKNTKRKKTFKEFNNLIIYDSKRLNVFSTGDDYDYYMVGSDQVWNPKIGRCREVDLLSFCKGEKRISYAASFGINEIEKNKLNFLKTELEKFKAISVRENVGETIINNLLPNKKVETLVDPTMLLTSEEWNKVSIKPKMLKSDKYILNYFLGSLSNDRKIEIERIAKENDCEIINILDNESPFYECGPSEFLWLEKNAFLICTDSFHSSVFAILFNRPFIIFDREQDGITNMNSRLDTLVKTFKLKDRKFDKTINEKNLNHDYSEAYRILEEERKKSKDFLERALDLK